MVNVLKFATIACIFTMGVAIGKTEEASVVGNVQKVENLGELDKPFLDSIKSKGTEHKFQSHVTRLLELFANHMYGDEGSFLRELIANCCDAINKARLKLLKKAADGSSLESLDEYKIVVKADKERGLLSISDNGIGMTRDDMENFLGSIARSGTADFNLEEMKDKSKKEIATMIGQFGVGFYSVFFAADQVWVVSKHEEDQKQWVWQSDASATYTITEDPRGVTLKRGTQVILKLKENAKRFLEDEELEKSLRSYFEHDNYPIFLVKHEEKEVPEEKEAATEEKQEDKKDDEKEKKDVVEVEDENKEKTSEPATKKVMVENEVLISQNLKPVWRRSPKDVQEEEYKAHYKVLTKDYSDPLAFKHIRLEGSDIEFVAILYVPNRPFTDPFDRKDKDKNKIKLFVRGVFVTDKLPDFMPEYLSFVTGIIDSDDLPLNISREMLQNSTGIKLIQKRVLSKVFELFDEIAADEKKFKEFYKAYGNNLKMEIITNERYRSKLGKYLRYKSSASDKELVSLDQYIERLSEGDKNNKIIYYLAGPSMEEVKGSPFLEKLVEQKKEVLFMTDPTDEHCIQALGEYQDFKFQSIAKEGLKLDEEESEENRKELEAEFKPLTEWLGKTLSKDVQRVVLSTRLTKSPCAVVAQQHGWTGNMERVIMAQSSASDPIMSFFSGQQKIFEINPKNPIIKKLLTMVKEQKDEKHLKRIVKSLYDATMIWSGYSVKDTKLFAKNIDLLTRRVLGVEVEEVEEEEKEEKEKDDENIEDNEDDINLDNIFSAKDMQPDEEVKLNKEEHKEKTKPSDAGNLAHEEL